jgi:nitrite reductase/ring-hydroxylating ferredoxin subunit
LIDGQLQCPYHGWQYTTSGKVMHQPSIRKMLPNVYVDGRGVHSSTFDLNMQSVFSAQPEPFVSLIH